MIAHESWKIIETILRRYPKSKKEYQEYIEEVMSRRGTGEDESTYSEDYTKPQSSTEAAALRMTSVYADRIKKEIEAVEFAYNDLKPEEQKVIRLRYWTGGKKPVPYLRLTECGYSERQMKRIVYKTVKRIGKIIGEIR